MNEGTQALTESWTFDLSLVACTATLCRVLDLIAQRSLNVVTARIDGRGDVHSFSLTVSGDNHGRVANLADKMRNIIGVLAVDFSQHPAAAYESCPQARHAAER
jgi:ACT domain-containing protein